MRDPDPWSDPDTWVNVSISPRDHDEPIVLEHDLRYFGAGMRVRIPKGFAFDGASVPGVRVFFRIIRPFLIHDYMYRVMRCPRKLADRVMYANMKYDGFPWGLRILVYWGVRIGGWRAWRRAR